jgi:putative pyruvate formate lyase activating enzyme
LEEIPDERESNMAFLPSYVSLYEKGELKERVESLGELLRECCLCPRRCGVDRMRGETGYCGAGAGLTVSSAFPHFGEEAPLVGRHGSGTIFLTHCNLRCVFCQNYDISHQGAGSPATLSEMARAMVRLQNLGCHNINFVTPTHYAPQIVASVAEAVPMGLRIPIVYNCSGYESIEVIRLLDGIVDIYMPDAKFMGEDSPRRFCSAPDYPSILREVLKEMHRQVGDLAVSSLGIAERGLLIRHLVMPGGTSASKDVLSFIAQEISPHAYVNIMDQYRPEYRALDFPDIGRRVTRKEYLEAVQWAKGFGLYRGF